jgi:hypothetical protein
MSPIYVQGKVVLAQEFTWNETVWNPSMITTALWLDAADASTVIISSGRISQWSDKSGNSRHATQATVAQQPVVTANAQNSRSVVEFNPASNAFQQLVLPSSLTSLGHVFFVAKKNNVNDSDVVSSNFAAGDDVRSVSLGSTTGSDFLVQQITGSLLTAVRNQWHVAEIETTGANASLGINGTRTTSADTDTMQVSHIGRYANSNITFANQYSFRGMIGEYIAIASSLSTTNRQKTEGYLAHKWGLTANLPNDHPYKTVGPTP